MADSVLVTGGAGYLGSILCERLLRRGFRVTVLDNLLYGEQSLFHLCAEPRFAFVRGDVRDEHLVRRLISEADILIPLAAIVGAPACDRDPALARGGQPRCDSHAAALPQSRGSSLSIPTTNSGYGTTIRGRVLHRGDPAGADLALRPDQGARPRRPSSRGPIDHSPAGHGVRYVAPDAARSAGQSLRATRPSRGGRSCSSRRTSSGTSCISATSPTASCTASPMRQRMAGRPYNVGLDSANLSKEELAIQIRQACQGPVDPTSPSWAATPTSGTTSSRASGCAHAGFEARRSLDDGIQELIKGYQMLGRGQVHERMRVAIIAERSLVRRRVD